MGSSLITTLLGYITSLVTGLIPEFPKAFEALFFDTSGSNLVLNTFGEIGLVFLALGIVVGMFYTFKRILIRR